MARTSTASIRQTRAPVFARATGILLHPSTTAWWCGGSAACPALSIRQVMLRQKSRFSLTKGVRVSRGGDGVLEVTPSGPVDANTGARSHIHTAGKVLERMTNFYLHYSKINIIILSNIGFLQILQHLVNCSKEKKNSRH